MFSASLFKIVSLFKEHGVSLGSKFVMPPFPSIHLESLQKGNSEGLANEIYIKRYFDSYFKVFLKTTTGKIGYFVRSIVYLG